MFFAALNTNNDIARLLLDKGANTELNLVKVTQPNNLMLEYLMPTEMMTFIDIHRGGDTIIMISEVWSMFLLYVDWMDPFADGSCS